MTATPQPPPSPEKILRDLLESAEQAIAARQVAWRLFEAVLSTTMEVTARTGDGEARSYSSSSWNPGVPAYRKYKDFFDIVDVSLLQTMVSAVCRIFDDTPKMSSVYRYLKLIEGRLGAPRAHDFKRRLQPLRQAVESLREVRNLAVAHTSMHHTFDELLRDNNTFKLVSVQFLQDLAAILNELRDEAGIEQAGQVSTNGCYTEAARGVISALIYGLPIVEMEGLVKMRTQIPE